MDIETKKRLLQLALAILPPIIAWMGLGFPIDRTALAILATALGGAIFAWLKGLEIAEMFCKVLKKIKSA